MKLAGTPHPYLLPLTIDELLVLTFAPHTGAVAVGNDGTAVMGVTPQGDLVVVPAPFGQNFNEMTDDEYDIFADTFSQIVHVL